jgi:ABC-2 type transport system permease protein
MAIKSNKYWASIAIAIRHQLAQRGQLVGRFFLYIVIVYLFHQVFESVQAPASRLWYLAITEWIILSAPPLAFQLADDINSGQIAYFMLRPMHFLNVRLMECLGAFSVRFVLLGITCVGLGLCLTGYFPVDVFTWVVGIFFAILSALLCNSVLILIGLCAFWLRDIKTLIYLNLTATLCFGGLIVPLSFYSPLVKTISFCTPYPWILWWPAEFMTGGTINVFFALMAWSGWMLVLWGLIVFVYQQGIKSFIVEGG